MKKLVLLIAVLFTLVSQAKADDKPLVPWTPAWTVLNFCDCVRRGDVDRAYNNYLSIESRKAMPEIDFEKAWSIYQEKYLSTTQEAMFDFLRALTFYEPGENGYVKVSYKDDEFFLLLKKEFGKWKIVDMQAVMMKNVMGGQ